MTSTGKCSHPQPRGLKHGGTPVDLPPELLSLVEAASRLDLSGTFTVREAAEVLQITPDKTYDLIHRGEIPYIALGRQYRIGKFALWCFINGVSGDELVDTVMPRISQPHDGRVAGNTPRRRQVLPFGLRPGR